LIWEGLVTLLLIFGGRFLFSLFLREPPEILDMGTTYLRILAACQLFMALEGACAGTFRGMGRTLPPSRVQHYIKYYAPVFMLVVCPVDGIERVVAGHHGFGDASRYYDVYLVYALCSQITPSGRTRSYSGCLILFI
jgi:Na+-driven multidrug efflux pump